MSLTKKVVLFIAFIMWTVVVALFSQPLKSSFAIIKIDNQAQGTIKSIAVNFETGNIDYSAIFKIPNGKQEEIIFPLYGEASYKILVTFSDGKTLKGGGAYVDPVLSQHKEMITDSKIISN